MVRSTSNLSNCAFCGTPLQSTQKVNPYIVKCPNCGREIPIPKDLSQDAITKINLAHDKRNVHLFDEAYDRYNDIIKQDPDNTDAYWGLFLCDYGIVYVDDQMTGNYIPTMNRYLEQPTLDNRFYKRLLDVCEPFQKEYYEKEAKYIESVRQEIEYHTSNQKEYDIFICYKKSVLTEKGELETKESRHAKNIYTELQKQGYENIFFAEETLKGNPGAKWEALIYTAIQTSKIMILMCSSDEYIRSAWVKNEWSRFLKQTEINREKTIIPIQLGGFDFNRLPYKIRSFQGLDMQSTSFIDDLIRKTEAVIPILPENTIKKKEITVINQRKQLNRDTIEIVRRKIGNKNVSEFKVTPSIEKEIDNIKKIYIKRERFSKAVKRFEKLLEKYPDVEEVVWGKICASLSATDDRLETAQITKEIEDTFEDFELLMNITGDKAKTYISYYEQYLIRAIEQKEFYMILLLFQFLLSWKEQEDQISFGIHVYETFKTSLESCLETMEESKEDCKYFDETPEVLSEITRILPEEKNDIFFKRYNEITYMLITYGKFHMAKELNKTVIELDEYNTQGIFNQGLIQKRVKGIREYEDCVLNADIEPWFEKLLASGYKGSEVHHTILTSAITLLKQQKYEESFQTMDMIVGYFPESKYPVLVHKLERYCDLLITDEMFEEADKYANYILSIDATNSHAYWTKLKIKLKASTNLDVLVNSNLELMEYQEFENALNAETDNKEILQFYDFDDELNEDTEEMKQFRKALKKHYSIFNSIASDYPGLHRFNTMGYPKMKEEYKDIITCIKALRKNLMKKTWMIVVGFLTTIFSLQVFEEIQSTTLYGEDFPQFIIELLNYIVVMSSYLIYIVAIWVVFTIVHARHGFKKIIRKPIKNTFLFIISITALIPFILSIPYFLPFSESLNYLIVTISLPLLFIILPFTVIYLFYQRKIINDSTYKHYGKYKKRYLYRQIIAIILAIIIILVI